MKALRAKMDRARRDSARVFAGAIRVGIWERTTSVPGRSHADYLRWLAQQWEAFDRAHGARLALGEPYASNPDRWRRAFDEWLRERFRP